MMNNKELQEIVDMIESSSIDVLNIEKDTFKLYYQKESAKPFLHTNNYENESTSETAFIDNEAFEETVQTKINIESGTRQITSPMIGTFYSSRDPNSGPLIQMGKHIKNEDTVCMIEAMKLFNDVRSPYEGEIIEILAQDGDIIEYGQPLFKVKVSE